MIGVSFVITVFNKTAFLPRVIDALARQEGPFRREFVFVDDGSTDGSAEMIEALTADWSDPVRLLRQRNQGASAATNAGVAGATHSWIRLVDGDDLLVPGATGWMLDAAQTFATDLVYGALGSYDVRDPDPLHRRFARPPSEKVEDGLSRFIHACPSNSSTVLVAAERYWRAGGCDVRLVSPDQALFLRLFALGGGARMDGSVALIPAEAPGRLSEQQRRSRYESVLALHFLVAETPGLDARHVKEAYRRALSRAYRFQRRHGGRWLFSPHLFRYLRSKLGVPADPAGEMLKALAAFTESGAAERPAEWLPGAIRDTAGEQPPALGTAQRG